MPKTKHPCYPRRRFSSEGSAAVAARLIANAQGVRRYVVPCDKCGGWHLSDGDKNRG